jgi:bifunctional phosphoglucose/phosphomannose isomerase
LFSESQIRRVDRGGALAAYQAWPALAREGFAVAYEGPAPPAPARAYIMGMGGSAAAGDILAGWLSLRKGADVGVLKGSVPEGMEGTLAIACSVSGNTEETVQMLRAAVERGSSVVAISGEGRLSEEAQALGVQCIRVPPAPAQRLMLPFLVYASLAVLNSAFDLGCEDEARESIVALDSEWSEASPQSAEPGNRAKALAASLVTKTPAIYGDRVAYGVGTRFKNVVNENAKRHAHFDVVPEAFHNEIESWEDEGTEFLPVFLRHSYESPRDLAKLDRMVKILDGMGKSPVQVRGRGASCLSQLMSMTYRLDMASYYLSVALGRDPLPTALLDRLKSDGVI